MSGCIWFRRLAHPLRLKRALEVIARPADQFFLHNPLITYTRGRQR